MDKKIIATDNAPGALGPYSQAVNVGDFVYTSGQIAINPETGEIPESIEEQTKQVFENLGAVLEEAGTGLEKIVKTTVFLSDMNNFTKMNDVYKTFFTDKYPARSAVEVARLPKDVLIEVEAIAVK